MNISEIIRGILNQTKKIDIISLPTQGLFYKPDFEIKIKKAEMEHIIDYELNYDKDNLYVVIESVKKIVRNNTLFSKGYVFEDIKSVDIIYLFLEIVKISLKKPIEIPYFNDEKGHVDMVKFENENFNYFDFSNYMKYYDKENAELLIDGWKFSMPSIGIENCLTQFLFHKSDKKDADKWNNYSYDFLFFVGNHNNLSFDEIENLVMIFNVELEHHEQKKINSIIKKFMNLTKHSLKIDNKVVEIKSKIDLSTIWKS